MEQIGGKRVRSETTGVELASDSHFPPAMGVSGGTPAGFWMKPGCLNDSFIPFLQKESSARKTKFSGTVSRRTENYA